MARAITSPELALLRNTPQGSRFYLAIQQPSTVFTARVNQSFLSSDMVAQITYDNATGNYADIEPGMTVYVGSSAGAHDLGLARVRKAATATVLYIGEISEISWADNLYLTVVNMFQLRAKHINITQDIKFFMDYDIPYSNQNSSFAPVPVLGAPQVLWLTDSDVTASFDASDSWCLSAGTLSHLWSFPGSISSTDSDTETPTATYNATGQYRFRDTVTRSGVSSVGHRNLYVFDKDNPPVTQFKINSCGGDLGGGGWEFEVTLYDEAGITEIIDGAEVVLFARDIYGSTEGSIGPLPGCENVIAVGYIDRNTLVANPDGGYVTFTVKGPQYWLNLITGYPLGLKQVTTTPASWVEMQNLTVDKFFYSLIYWRSTAALMMDIYPSGDTRTAVEIQAPTETLWQQITQKADETILARPHTDRYGRLFLEVDPQYVPVANRGNIPVIMTVTKSDYLRDIEIVRLPFSQVSRVELSGVVVSGGGGYSVFSLANGHVFKNYGEPLVKDRLLLSSQSQANILAGLVMAKENLTYSFHFECPENNRMVDICPAQYLAFNIAANDTPRGIAYSGNAVPTHIELIFHDTYLTVQIDCDQATAEQLAINGDVPVMSYDSDLTFDEWIPPAFPTLKLPSPEAPTAPIIFTNTESLGIVAVLSDTYGLWYTKTFGDTSPRWISANFPFTTAEIQSLLHFELCRTTGRAYLANSLQVWATKLGENTADLMGTEAFFRSAFSQASYSDYVINAIGCDPLIDWRVGVFIGGAYNDVNWRQSNVYLGSGTSKALAKTLQIVESGQGNAPGIRTVGRMTYYDGFWFVSEDALNDGSRLRKLNNGLTTLIGSLNLGVNFETIYHIHAEAADYIYHSNDGTIHRITSAGTSSADLSVSVRSDPQQIACDPTGQYLMMAQGANSVTPKRSTDFGATWGTFPSFPGAPDLRTSRIINMGDADKWLWVYNDNNDTQALKIYYTADFGNTWTSKLGDLLSYLPTTAGIKEAHYA